MTPSAPSTSPRPRPEGFSALRDDPERRAVHPATEDPHVMPFRHQGTRQDRSDVTAATGDDHFQRWVPPPSNLRWEVGRPLVAAWIVDDHVVLTGRCWRSRSRFLHIASSAFSKVRVLKSHGRSPSLGRDRRCEGGTGATSGPYISGRRSPSRSITCNPGTLTIRLLRA
jgi:hypothetical protein